MVSWRDKLFTKTLEQFLHLYVGEETVDSSLRNVLYNSNNCGIYGLGRF